MIELIKMEPTIDINNLLIKMRNDKNIYEHVNSILFVNFNTYIITKDSQFIGLVKIHREVIDNYSIEIAILNKYTNQGIGKEVIEKIVEHIKQNYNYHKILMRTKYENKRCEKLAYSCGFNIDYDEIEMSMAEGSSYNIYSITNKEYKSRVILKVKKYYNI